MIIAVENEGAKARRKAILTASTKLFCQHGYSGTRMSDIADAIGVTKPVIYRYYTSKEELFEAWLEFELVDSRDKVSKLIAAPQFTIREKTEKLISLLVQSLNSKVAMSPWRIALVEADSFPHITKMVCTKFKDPILKEIESMFEIAIKNNEVGGTSATNLARLFTAPVASSAVMVSTFGLDGCGGLDFADFLAAHNKGFWAAWGK